MRDLKKLLRFARPYWKQALYALVTLLAMVGLDLAIPRLVGRIIDQGIRGKNMGAVLSISAAMLLIAALDALAAVLNNSASIRVGEGVARDLRDAVFVKIQDFSYGNLDRFSTGRLMVRLSSDTGAVQRLMQVTLRIGTRAPLTMAGSIVLMFVTRPALAATMVPILIASIGLILLFSAKMEPFFRAVQQKMDSLNTVLQENIAGARLVKSFVRGERESARFGEANDGLASDTVKVMRFMSSMTPALTMFINAGLVLVVWLGGKQAIKSELSLGQIVAFANYLLATMHPLTAMTQLSNTWANGLASAKRINEVLEAVPDVAEPSTSEPLPDATAGGISFEGVGFHYDGAAGEPAQPVLEAISARAEPGKTLAILGATGSGKSSLVNLIPRFYDVCAGSVSIDGADVRRIGQDSLLRHIAVVPQETILFTGTVRDNIRYGKPGAGEDEVVAAAKAAQAHDFILSLPQGYDTRVEERGRNLSGGQRQRVAIARALIQKPSILILDDSTSAVDVETETKIQDAIRERMSAAGASEAGASATTCVVVAQRISTVLNADKILVLDEGRVVAEGTHRQLLRSSPVYREIYDSQLGGGLKTARPSEGGRHGL